MFTNFDKALVVPVVLAILSLVGINGAMTVEELVAMAVTAVAVYMVPNKKA